MSAGDKSGQYLVENRISLTRLEQEIDKFNRLKKLFYISLN